jgi:hypothetical protein
MARVSVMHIINCVNSVSDLHIITAAHKKIMKNMILEAQTPFFWRGLRTRLKRYKRPKNSQKRAKNGVFAGLTPSGF